MTTTPDSPIVVRTSGASKRFVVRKDNSLKERIVTLGRAGRRHREDFWALRDINLEIRAGETVALIGHNGSGKSTLLKLIGGILDPSTGSVEGRGRVAALLELGAGFHPDLTGRENVFLNAAVLGLSKEETEARFADIATFAGIGDFMDSQVKFYSSGMYVRLAFAVAINTDPDILIVDEVLAVGDEAFQRKCMDRIRTFQEEGRTIILVTHSMPQVAQLADRAVLLNHGEIVVDGDTNVAIAAFRDLLEQRRLEELASKKREPDDPSHARIVGVDLLIGDEPAIVVPTGSNLAVEIRVEHPTGIDGWLVVLQIDSENGQVVFGTGSDHAAIDPGPLRGERTVRIDIPELNLGGGKYFVSVALQDVAGRQLAAAQLIASFDVPAPSATWGVLGSTPVFSFPER